MDLKKYQEVVKKSLDAKTVRNAKARQLRTNKTFNKKHPVRCAAIGESAVKALQFCAKSNNYSRALRFIEVGTQLNATNAIMFTPLHYAAMYGRERMCKLFIEHGASLTARTNMGYTPIDLGYKYKRIASLFKKYNSTPSPELFACPFK